MIAPTAGPAPRWVRVLAAVAVIVVAAVAAVASYAHMRTLGQRAGEAWRADLLPLSVDGLLVAASLVLMVRRRAGLAAGWLPWAGLGLGVAASLAANVAAASPTALGRVVAAWPPLAFAVSFELLVMVLRDSAARPAVRPPVGRPGPYPSRPDADRPGRPDAGQPNRAGTGRRRAG